MKVHQSKNLPTIEDQTLPFELARSILFRKSDEEAQKPKKSDPQTNDSSIKNFFTQINSQLETTNLKHPIISIQPPKLISKSKK